MIEKIGIGFNSPIVEEIANTDGAEIFMLIKVGAEMIDDDRYEEVCKEVEQTIADLGERIACFADGPIEQITMMLMLCQNCLANAIGYRQMLELRIQMAELEGGSNDSEG